MAQNDAATAAELTPQKRSLLEALLLGASLTDAAEQAGCSRRTAGRWAAEPEFQAALKEAQTELHQRVLRALRSKGIRAVATLSRNLSREVQPSVQVRAAQVLLEQLMKQTEFAELEERLTALEEALAAQPSRIRGSYSR